MSAWQRALDNVKRHALARALPEGDDADWTARMVKAHESGDVALHGRVLREAAAEVVLRGWHWIVSVRTRHGAVVWHASAKLYPAGRSSTTDQWAWLGRMAKHLGCPRKPMVMRDDAPNEPVHWHWEERTAGEA